MWRAAPDSPPVTLTVRARSLPDTTLRPAVMPVIAFSGRGSGAVPQNSPACSAARYSVPVTRLQVPVSSPVTRVLRPTSVPVTRWPRLVLVVPTLAGAGSGSVPQNSPNCSAPTYSVPVTLRQVPASLPVTCAVRSTWLPVTVLPASVVPISTFGGSGLMRPQGRQGGASPRPFSDCSMRRWRTAEIGASSTGVAGRAASTRAEKVSPCWQPQLGAAAGAAVAVGVGAGALVRAAMRASVALRGAAAWLVLSALFPCRESAWRRAMAASRPLRRSAVAVAVASLIIWFPYASAVDH